MNVTQFRAATAVLPVSVSVDEAALAGAVAELRKNYDVKYSFSWAEGRFRLEQQAELFVQSGWPEVEGVLTTEHGQQVLHISCRPPKAARVIVDISLLFCGFVELCGILIALFNGVITALPALLMPLILGAFSYGLVTVSTAQAAKKVLKVLRGCF